MFGRGLWTPDEPREADIAWRMSQQTDRTLPQLAGTPFLEKPPLSYWMSAAAISLFGDSAAAARVPNLLYAAITALAVGVPALALGTLVVWERRWSELRRWELYAGLVLQGLIIGPWVLAVARTGHGAEALRALFWNNVVGRFTQVAAPAALDYTSGHRNTAGKYLLELPLYLLPWTFAVAAALCRAWNRVREAAPSAT